MAPPSVSQYWEFAFHRPVDWRFRRAQELFSQGRRSSKRYDDNITLRVLSFLRAASRQRTGSTFAKLRYPDLFEAHRLHVEEPKIRLVLEARILAAQDPAEITSHTGIPHKVVQAYEDTFFIVRKYLRARDWINCVCLAKDNDTPERTLFKSLAYNGGPTVLEFLLPYFVGDIDYRENVEDLSTLQGIMDQKARMLIRTELSPSNETTRGMFGEMTMYLRERKNRTQNNGQLGVIHKLKPFFDLSEEPLSRNRSRRDFLHAHEIEDLLMIEAKARENS